MATPFSAVDLEGTGALAFPFFKKEPSFPDPRTVNPNVGLEDLFRRSKELLGDPTETGAQASRASQIAAGGGGPTGVGAGAGAAPGAAPGTLQAPPAFEQPQLGGGGDGGFPGFPGGVGGAGGAGTWEKLLGMGGDTLKQLRDLFPQGAAGVPPGGVNVPLAGGIQNLTPEMLQALQFASLSGQTLDPAALSAAQAFFPGKALGPGEIGAVGQIAEGQPGMVGGLGGASSAFSTYAPYAGALASALPGLLQGGRAATSAGIQAGGGLAAGGLSSLLGAGAGGAGIIGAGLIPLISALQFAAESGGNYQSARNWAGNIESAGARTALPLLELARTPADLAYLGFNPQTGLPTDTGQGLYEIGGSPGHMARTQGLGQIGSQMLPLMQAAQAGDPQAKALLAQINQQGLQAYTTEESGANPYFNRAPTNLPWQTPPQNPISVLQSLYGKSTTPLADVLGGYRSAIQPWNQMIIGPAADIMGPPGASAPSQMIDMNAYNRWLATQPALYTPSGE